ncbi:hypothetical protein BDB00DRAFT_836500, partial [Zychaea mexicana]|uniref:uncharacterized protein n=1 Tax=Zychaea mexicana TaxID=64656 RepID=UPI0022FE11F7
MVLILATSVSIGSLVVSLLFGNSLSFLVFTGYIIHAVMVRMAGLISLILIALLFPTVWIRRIRESETRNEIAPGYSQNDTPSWYD